MKVAFDSERARVIAIFSLTFSSVGIEANSSVVQTYGESWLKVSAFEIINKQLIVSHTGGVSLIDLESKTISETMSISAQFVPKHLTAYKDGTLFISKHSIHFWKTSGMELFAGQATEEGSTDGSA